MERLTSVLEAARARNTLGQAKPAAKKITPQADFIASLAKITSGLAGIKQGMAAANGEKEIRPAVFPKVEKASESNTKMLGAKIDVIA